MGCSVVPASLNAPQNDSNPHLLHLSSPSSPPSDLAKYSVQPCTVPCVREAPSVQFSPVNTVTFPMMLSCSNDLLPTPLLSHLYPGIMSMPFFPLWLQTKHGKRRSLQHWQQQYSAARTWFAIFQLSYKNVSLSCFTVTSTKVSSRSVHKEILILIHSWCKGRKIK